MDSVMHVGRGALLAKLDVKHAFRICPVHQEDQHLLLRTLFLVAARGYFTVSAQHIHGVNNGIADSLSLASTCRSSGTLPPQQPAPPLPSLPLFPYWTYELTPPACYCTHHQNYLQIRSPGLPTVFHSLPALQHHWQPPTTLRGNADALFHLHDVHDQRTFGTSWSRQSLSQPDSNQPVEVAPVEPDAASPAAISRRAPLFEVQPLTKHSTYKLRPPARQGYLIDCRKCRKQYVGEIQNPLHIRLNGHCNDITHKRTEKPVASHFNSPGHSLDDLRIAVLEVMRSFDESLRRRRESYWIKQLRSLHAPRRHEP